MNKYANYFKYLYRHKLYVGMALLRMAKARIFANPLLAIRLAILAITHDWTKFLPSELSPYAEYFSYKQNEQPESVRDAFDQAWNRHQKRNPHHYQYHYLYRDDGSFSVTKMRLIEILEMVADWWGAGYAINGKPDVKKWYENHESMKLHPSTRAIVEDVIEEVESWDV